MKTYQTKTYKEGGLYGYRIYFGSRKVGARIAQFATESEARKDALREIEYQEQGGPLVTIHDPRFAPMPHFANLP